VRVSLSVLIRASHPIPCVVVTALSAALFGIAGKPVTSCLLGAAAVLAGQLSIGWSNDLIDAQRDTAALRRDKPLAQNREFSRQVRFALGLALVLTVVLSLLLGWRAAALHAVTVGSGWAYNLGLKASAWSAAAYFLAFGALPAIATLARPDPDFPPAWVLCAAGLLGVAAHFGNALPDLPDDLVAGVRGLPQRLGARRSMLAAAAATVVAAVIIDAGAGRHRPWATIAGTAAVLLLVAAAIRGAARNPRGQTAFRASMAAAAVDVLILAANHAL
jgi:4-hydroxybenzoate polyprenyltransferase